MFAEQTSPPATKGLVMRSEARYYDLLAWLLTLGRERAFRERLVDLARIQPGERVLDVGCGTGSLAIAAKRRVGPAGAVEGVDASPEMIARAVGKAGKARVEARFQTAVVEALPFPDASFDVVLSTLMLHHLPRPVRRQCAAEIGRVLRPGGRVLAVDFATPARTRGGLLARLHRHGHLALADIVGVLDEAGLAVVETGEVGVSDLHFALATTSSATTAAGASAAAPVTRSLPTLPAPRWILVPAVALLLLVHGMIVSAVVRRIALPLLVLAALAALFVAAHAGVGGAVHAVLRRRRSSRHRARPEI